MVVGLGSGSTGWLELHRDQKYLPSAATKQIIHSNTTNIFILNSFLIFNKDNKSERNLSVLCARISTEIHSIFCYCNVCKPINKCLCIGKFY